jgi:hypothetical protein
LGINQELSALQQILEWLNDDACATNANLIPESLKAQILSIISECGCILRKINDVIEKHSGPLGPTKWVMDGKKEINSLREALGAYRGALNIALETVAM